MAIQEAEESEPEDEDNYQLMAEEALQKTPWTYAHRSIRVPSDKKVVKWIGDPVKDDGRKMYYRLVQHFTQLAYCILLYLLLGNYFNILDNNTNLIQQFYTYLLLLIDTYIM